MTTAPTRRADEERRRDPQLHAIHEFAELVAASARSSAQRERLLRAARVPLTGASLNVLGLIERRGPIVVSDLARRLGIDQSTASRQLRPLEDLGLVARTMDRDDRRVAWLSVTVKGRRVRERVRDVILNDFDVALGDWSVADRTLLAELLDRFRTDLLRARVDDSGWSVDKV